MRYKLSLMIVGLLVMATLGACQLAPRGEQLVTVTMDEWVLHPSVAAVSPGKVTFEVVNQGKTGHELVILKTNRAPNDLAMRTDGVKIDEAASGQNVGEIEDIEAGETKTASFELTAGRYVLTCNEPEHYKQGMVAVLEVR